MKPKLMIVGHARHGKDTVCSILADYGYTWISSSWACGEITVWPLLQGQYPDYQACFDDRHNRREVWFNAIKAYNTPDETRLGREIYKANDIYCGIRRFEELSALKEAHVIDFVIWIDASKRMPPEDKSSCTVHPFQAHYILDNNGTLQDLRIRVGKLYRGFLRPWELRKSESRCLSCGGSLADNEHLGVKWCESCGKVQP